MEKQIQYFGIGEKSFDIADYIAGASTALLHFTNINLIESSSTGPCSLVEIIEKDEIPEGIRKKIETAVKDCGFKPNHIIEVIFNEENEEKIKGFLSMSHAYYNLWNIFVTFDKEKQKKREKRSQIEDDIQSYVEKRIGEIYLKCRDVFGVLNVIGMDFGARNYETYLYSGKPPRWFRESGDYKTKWENQINELYWIFPKILAKRISNREEYKEFKLENNNVENKIKEWIEETVYDEYKKPFNKIIVDYKKLLSELNNTFKEAFDFVGKKYKNN